MFISSLVSLKLLPTSQAGTCTPWAQAMSDMSKDGPKNIDGAEEAKKMIKRCRGLACLFQSQHVGPLCYCYCWTSNFTPLPSWLAMLNRSRYQIRARALDHAVGERKISSIQAGLVLLSVTNPPLLSGTPCSLTGCLSNVGLQPR